MKTFFLILTLNSYLFGFTININIKGVKNDKGKLYKGKVLNASSLSVKFEDIPSGIYAISLYHDENNNTILDKNFLGIPKEGYGFSTNYFVFGAPDFDDASFEINSNKILMLTERNCHA